MTAQAFTAWELDQPERHELFRGEVFRVFGMGGARREHAPQGRPALAWCASDLIGKSLKLFTI